MASRKRLLSGLASAFLFGACSGPAASVAVSQRPTAPSDPAAFARSIGTATYLLLIDGKVVASHGELDRAYRLHSVRKSILSALVGIEVAAGRLSLDQTLQSLKISDYSPLTPEEKRATLGQLLASRSGVFRPATHENEGFDTVRPQPGSHAPGTHWFYSNWDFNAVGTIFQQETGQSVCKAFLKNIAGSLALQDFSAANCSWRYSARSRHPAYVFRMSTRDLAAFGELMRNHGRWAGRQIIPADWIDLSTAPRSAVTRPDGSPMPGAAYGLMWWTAFDGKRHFPGLDIDLGPGAFSASGTGTQLLVVAPARKLVFVHLVDTDTRSRSVSQDDVGRLLALLLRANEQ